MSDIFLVFVVFIYFLALLVCGFVFGFLCKRFQGVGMKLKTVVENMVTQFKWRLLTINPKGLEVMTCPCVLCEGHGFLIENVYFSRADSSSDYLKKGDGSKIFAQRILDCPTCTGTGLDNEKVLEAVRAA